MSATVPAKLPVDKSTERQLAKGELREGTVSKRTKKRLTSRGATIAALIIAVLWTTPTFGLFITSFRPAGEINRNGW